MKYLEILILSLISYESYACPFFGCSSYQISENLTQCWCGNYTTPFNYEKVPNPPEAKYILNIQNSNKIPKDAFFGLDIDTLNIAFTSYQNISSFSFRSVKTLDILVLANVDFIESGSFIYIEKLTKFLTITNAKFKTCEEINRLKNLTGLNVGNTYLEDLSLSNLVYLTDMVISYNKLKQITLTNLTNLKNLNINNNQLNYINLLTSLPSLTYLNLASNKIEYLDPEGSGLIPELNFLDLSNNNLVEIYIKDLQKLSEIRLNNNKLRNVGIENLYLLKSLNLDNNQIQSLAIFYSGLKQLSLFSNGLSSLEFCTIVGNLYLEELNLRNNSIADISLLSNVSTLRVLYLDNNQIAYIPYGFFQNFPNLFSLYLSSNRIKGSFSLENLEFLSYIDISNNYFESLYISNMMSLEYLKVDNNNYKNVTVYNSKIRLFELTDLILNDLILANLSYLENAYFKNISVSNFQLTKLDNLVFLYLLNVSYFELPFTYFPKLFKLEVDNSYSMFKYFPDISTHQQLDILVLTNLRLTSISGQFLSKFPSVSYLDLSNNFLNSFSLPNVFQKMKELKLSNNKLSSFSQTILNNAPIISNLDLSKNIIQTISFSNLKYLTRLDVSGNNLKLISSNTFKNLFLLEDLNLSNNLIQSLSIVNLTALTKLDLSGNSLITIKNSLVNSNYLRILNLSKNKLKVENIVLSQNVYLSLNELYLDMNGISSISNTFFSSYKFLKILSLKNNFLTSFTLSNLGSLEILYLDSNKLIQVSLIGLERLFTLTLSNNLLSRINFNSEFKSLITLNMVNNKLTSLSKLDLSKFPNLYDLDLSKNLIKTINTDSFDASPQLSTLNLVNNFLTATPNITKLNRLYGINLSNQNGKLDKIQNYAFSKQQIGYYGLKIDLTKNKIQQFSNKMLCLYSTPRIEVISLKIDCNLEVNNCVYKNLEILLDKSLDTLCFTRIKSANSTYCKSQPQFIFYEVKTENYQTILYCPGSLKNQNLN